MQLRPNFTRVSYKHLFYLQRRTTEDRLRDTVEMETVRSTESSPTLLYEKSGARYRGPRDTPTIRTYGSFGTMRKVRLLRPSSATETEEDLRRRSPRLPTSCRPVAPSGCRGRTTLFQVTPAWFSGVTRDIRDSLGRYEMGFVSSIKVSEILQALGSPGG